METKKQSMDKEGNGTLYAENIYYLDFRLPRKGDIYLVSVGLHGAVTQMTSVATYNHSNRRQKRHIIGHIENFGLRS